MKIVIEIEDSIVEQAFTIALEEFGYVKKDGFREEEFIKEFEKDLGKSLDTYGLSEFFYEGINNDQYMDFYENGEE